MLVIPTLNSLVFDRLYVVFKLLLLFSLELSEISVDKPKILPREWSNFDFNLGIEEELHSPLVVRFDLTNSVFFCDNSSDGLSDRLLGLFQSLNLTPYNTVLSADKLLDLGTLEELILHLFQ